MTRRPIIFTSESAEAIIRGDKPMTRRVVRMDDIDWIGGASDNRNDPDLWGLEGPDGVWYVLGRGHRDTQHGGNCSIACPYGDAGGRLWVREPWRVTGWDESGEVVIQYGQLPSATRYWVKAPDEFLDQLWDAPKVGPRRFERTRRPIYMPRWASRLELELQDVAVERLQDISTEDAQSELGWPEGEGARVAAFDIERREFAKAWDRLHHRSGHLFATNPWVWVLMFDVYRHGPWQEDND